MIFGVPASPDFPSVGVRRWTLSSYQQKKESRMFTIKFYSHEGGRQRIEAADSFTILRMDQVGGAEITLHRKNPSDDIRVDIGPHRNCVPVGGWPNDVFQKAIIENAAGRTTEIISLQPAPAAA